MDSHSGLPNPNQAVFDLEKVLNRLLKFKVKCLPWVDLITLYIERNVGVVKMELDETCEIIKPESHMGRGERRVVYSHGMGEIRLHWKRVKFKGSDGDECRKKIGWIKLTDRPYPRFQEIIANLLWRRAGEGNWRYTGIEWGADIIPVDQYAHGSLLRRDCDPLMPVATISGRKGVPPALVEIQDVIERTFHLNNGRKGIKDRNIREFTTAYWGTRDRLTRVKVYPGPKNVEYDERGFLRFEISKEFQALERCLKTERGGLYFPIRNRRPDIREFVKLLVPKDIDALAKAIHRREVRQSGPTRYDKLKLRATQKRINTALLHKPHSEFRNVVRGALGGVNLGYHFKQLYPIMRN